MLAFAAFVLCLSAWPCSTYLRLRISLSLAFLHSLSFSTSFCRFCNTSPRVKQLLGGAWLVHVATAAQSQHHSCLS